jgi:anthranilate synthase/aminodeoxychorismate synthase-like glutamine amidotransferase
MTNRHACHTMPVILKAFLNDSAAFMILLIDNYDSFVFNLARYCERLGVPTRVVRNDATDSEKIRADPPQAIVISPGPRTPQEAGCSIEVVAAFRGEIPIFGVCLGHQAIAAAYGCRIIPTSQPMHGRSSKITHSQTPLFDNVPTEATVGRYHSLVVDPDTVGGGLKATAWASDGTIMALEDQVASVYGVQFHPESILTPDGYQILSNFLRLAGIPNSSTPTELWNSERHQTPSVEPPRRQTPLTH